MTEEAKKLESPLLFSSALAQTILILLLVGGAFILGSLWTRVQTLERGLVTGSPAGVQPDKSAPTEAAGQAPAQPTPAEAGNVAKITKDDHVRGERSAQLALIEYSDIECPFCKRFHPTAAQLIDAYQGKVMWVYRHFPLSFHANAQKEAEATECANEQGGNDSFWKYLDTLFERTTSNGTGFALDQLAPLARELGLDETKFKECLDSGKYEKHVKDDMDGGAKAGVTGTPGNILLDSKTGKTRLIPGAVPFEQIKPVVDEMLK